MKYLLQTAFNMLQNDPDPEESMIISRRTDPPQNNALIVFVHGLGGTRYGKKPTWGHFPNYLYEDLPFADIGLYRYRTLWGRLRFTRSIDLDKEAEIFADIVRDLDSYTRIVLIGHSMGGLLCKAVIKSLLDTNQTDVLARIKGMVLMATPQLGSLRVIPFIWRLTADGRALHAHSKLTTELNKIFINRVNILESGPDQTDKFPIPTFAVIPASDMFVDELSAGLNVPITQQKRVTGAHTSIVKPENKDRDAYRFVHTKVENCIKRTGAVGPAKKGARAKKGPAGGRYRIVGFDLDGTLIRGLEFSWTAVWRYLQFPEGVQKAGMLRYRRRESSYQEWCDWACQMFRSKNLHRKDFSKIVEGISVTKNLREALGILKSDGFITAIISGGIDIFLDELIPDAKELFDEIFINKLKFDADGLISGVEVTPYDFEGKATALEFMCQKYGYNLSETVFVGEGFNDEYAAEAAGLTIAYPPTSQGLKTEAAVEIKDDDLLKIIDHVILK
jgi:HAD superfamily phosphoserine phosphatase-like hydrolase